ncbi:MAG: TonB-dependent receptor [Bacteroidetes bacterium]|nr:MAG: TonB-dependent receptor [Bacteroidota bacterium]
MNTENPTTIREKALAINLNPTIYGSFAEIGGGQEVARNFFKAGAAGGTIAKSMSAYDMVFSDNIYGSEAGGRYVSESRCLKMLDHEYNLLEERLVQEEYKDRCFFVFANTVTTLNYSRSNKPHGWMGVRFQLEPDSPPSDIIMHVRLHDNNTILQQRVLGELGVNLLWACYHHGGDIAAFLQSMKQDLSTDLLEIDMIRLSGPCFASVDIRIVSLLLVKMGFTKATIFGPDGKVYQPKDLLYKKNVFALRGRFRPLTKVTADMFDSAVRAFCEMKEDVEECDVFRLAEMTLQLLQTESDIEDHEQDFLDRADILSSQGHYVMISDFEYHYELVNYLNECRVAHKGLIVGVKYLLEIYERAANEGRELSIMHNYGRVFRHGGSFWVYPFQASENAQVYTASTMLPPPSTRSLHDFLLGNQALIEIEALNPEVLTIFSDDIVKSIQEGEAGWENSVPEGVAEMIVANQLFKHGSK